MIMTTEARLRLRVLIPAVENAVSGDAFRPGDILTARNGLTVEINNTDAEGRLVLADALALAAETPSDLTICMATLTGAARVAVGPDLAPFYTDDEGVADALMQAGRRVRDPLWRMPLFRPYREYLNSKVANIVNSASTPFGGAITAALFLQEFVPEGQSWAHLDLMAWNTKDRPGRPEGGEAVGIRALFHYLHRRFAKKSD
jgi:leucyl aminopeptidase